MNSQNPSGRRPSVLVAVSFLAGLIVATLFFISLLRMPPSKVGSRWEKAGLLRETSESFRTVVDKVSPAVVTIKATHAAKQKGHRSQEGGPDPYAGDPFFELFRQFMRRYGGPSPEQGPQTSLGSGIIIDKNGYIVTNNHVVDGASRIIVNLPEEESTDYPAKLVGSDTKSDLAVIKVELRRDLPAAVWADSDKVEVGDWALAIGSPFMLTHSVTMGIVSAKGRNSNSVTGSQYGYEMLQTDAAINPGNSGGPLCTIDGTVMGVNTAIFTQSGGYMGIGFAIPSNQAKEISSTLIKTGKIVRGWLGIQIEPIDTEMARDLGVPSGGIVHQVEKGSPAEKAGLRAGDVIYDVNGSPVKDISHVQQLVSVTKPGGKLTMKVINYDDKKTRALTATLEEMPSESQPGSSPPDAMNELSTWGLAVSAGRSRTGVRVDKVVPGSPADLAQLSPGDTILRVNRRPIHSVGDFRKLITGVKVLNLSVQRGGEELFLRMVTP